VDSPLDITVHGTTGYYCAGMNKQATIRVKGSAGPGVAENMMSGTVIVEGDASQYAGATGRGGLLVIKGNASSRCGISMKGIDIVVHGNVGTCRPSWRSPAASWCWATRARRWAIRSTRRGSSCAAGEVLGADCVEKEMRPAHHELLEDLLRRGLADGKARPEEFRRYGSARRLYNFNVDNASSY
jgi:hypothetical protein